jgi:hypothetical protein
MGLSVFLFIVGMVMSRGGNRPGPGVVLTGIGEMLFLANIVYGLFSTFFNLRCPTCKTYLGAVVSTLYAPFFVSDAYAPTCRGCGAQLLDDDARVRAKHTMRITFFAMIALPFLAAVVGWMLGMV